ncbi:hypothetical protein DNTS_033444 [Danionella cerebrum]|uniref:Noggin n=1 Tax=Danionella cerebrum TaxID=2873325 RepID=A0A553Q6G1_9TELE|nr:hypothetical protein DNTS_033444 [Danionella translucida]
MDSVPFSLATLLIFSLGFMIERGVSQHFHQLRPSDKLPVGTILEDPDPTLDPRERDLNETELRAILGFHFDQKFMSISSPEDKYSGQDDTNESEFPKPAPSGTMPKEIKAMEFDIQHGKKHKPKKLRKRLQLWLWSYTFCPVVHTWKDLGIRFWPRYLKVADCFNKRSCSVPEGMLCKPAKSTHLVILRWFCKKPGLRTRDNLLQSEHANQYDRKLHATHVLELSQYHEHSAVKNYKDPSNHPPPTSPSIILHPAPHPSVHPSIHLSIHPVQPSTHQTLNTPLPIIHPSTYPPPTHSPIFHPPLHQYIHLPSIFATIHPSSTHPSINSSVHPLIHLIIYSPTHSSTHRSSIHPSHPHPPHPSFIHTPIHPSFTHPSIHQPPTLHPPTYIHIFIHASPAIIHRPIHSSPTPSNQASIHT